MYFSRFFSPLGMAPVVGLVGLGFIQRGFPAVGVDQSIFFSSLFNTYKMVWLNIFYFSWLETLTE